jgi:peptidoglycan-associated lipoprotein
MTFRQQAISAIGSLCILLAGCSSATDQSSASGSEGFSTSPTTQGVGIDRSGIDRGAQDALRSGSGEFFVAAAGTDRVYFELDRVDLNQESRQVVTRWAEALRSRPQVRATIEGHTDERGTREYNLALGERRAMAVRSFLVTLGIDARRVETISFGKERPDELGSTEAAWSKNRRAVAVVQ